MSGVGFFIVVEGEAEVSAGEAGLGRLHPGDHFGNSALIGAGTHGDVTAVTPLTCLSWRPGTWKSSSSRARRRRGSSPPCRRSARRRAERASLRRDPPRQADVHMKHVAHWDDVEPYRRETGHLGGDWYDLGRAAGCVSRRPQAHRVDPGKWSTPAHVEGAEEEIFFVLGGSGLSWQDGEAFEVGEGDVLVHLPEKHAHTLRAGPEGLDVLAYGQRKTQGNTVLPRAGVAWMHPSWVRRRRPASLGARGRDRRARGRRGLAASRPDRQHRPGRSGGSSRRAPST